QARSRLCRRRGLRGYKGRCGGGGCDRVFRTRGGAGIQKEQEDEGILDETLHVSVLGRDLFRPNERAWSSHGRPYRHSAALAALPEVRSCAETSTDSCRGRRRNHRRACSGGGREVGFAKEARDEG